VAAAGKAAQETLSLKSELAREHRNTTAAVASLTHALIHQKAATVSMQTELQIQKKAFSRLRAELIHQKHFTKDLRTEMGHQKSQLKESTQIAEKLALRSGTLSAHLMELQARLAPIKNPESAERGKAHQPTNKAKYSEDVLAKQITDQKKLLANVQAQNQHVAQLEKQVAAQQRNVTLLAAGRQFDLAAQQDVTSHLRDMMNKQMLQTSDLKAQLADLLSKEVANGVLSTEAPNEQQDGSIDVESGWPETHENRALIETAAPPKKESDTEETHENSALIETAAPPKNNLIQRN